MEPIRAYQVHRHRDARLHDAAIRFICGKLSHTLASGTFNFDNLTTVEPVLIDRLNFRARNNTASYCLTVHDGLAQYGLGEDCGSVLHGKPFIHMS